MVTGKPECAGKINLLSVCHILFSAFWESASSALETVFVTMVTGKKIEWTWYHQQPK